MGVLVAPLPPPTLESADLLAHEVLQRDQNQVRSLEAMCRDLQSRLDALTSQLRLQQLPLSAERWAKVPPEIRQLVVAQACRIEMLEAAALSAPQEKASEQPIPAAKRRKPGPILNLSADTWEKTPPIVQELLAGLYEQLQQLSATPKSDPTLNLPLEIWNALPSIVQERLIELCQQVEALAQQLKLLRHQVYGSKSERIPEDPKGKAPTPDSGDGQESPPDQEPGNDPSGAHPSNSPKPKPAADTPKPAPAKRRRGCRKPLPVELPRVIETCDIEEAEKQCGCGAGKDCIGAEESSRVDWVPGYCQVITRRRLKWACRSCEGLDDTVTPAEPPPTAPVPEAGPDDIAIATSAEAESPVVAEISTRVSSAAPAAQAATPSVRRPVVSIAPAPKDLIPKGIPTAGLLAHIVVSKFLDSLPLYRQQQQFARMGIHIPRSTMVRWLITVFTACIPLMEVLRKEVLSGRVVGADESPVQVIKEPGRSASTKSYMWTFRGGADDKPAIQFVYAQTRSAEVAKEYLRGYKGGVQTDGYGGYDFLDDMDGIVHLGCMAHSRRKFVDVLKVLGKDWNKKLRGVAGEAILSIRELYALEREADSGQMTEEQRYALRQAKAKPILDNLHTVLIKAQGKVLPSSPLGEAVGYALNQWSRLTRYLEAGHYKIDNNLVEQVFRLFAVGRRNWLFCYSPDGAKASACFYSLILTAKANGLDPFWYLRALFERLPYANPECEQDYRSLLPQYIDRSLLQPKRQ